MQYLAREHRDSNLRIVATDKRLRQPRVLSQSQDPIPLLPFELENWLGSAILLPAARVRRFLSKCVNSAATWPVIPPSC